MIRVFVAVDLSSAALDELGSFIKGLTSKRWPVRWEDPSKLHITLFFVGWIEDKEVEVVASAVEKGVGGISPFSIRMGKLGVFPDFVEPRVVWVGIKGNQPSLVQLRKQVTQKLTEAGFETEKRAWIPHLSIGRVNKEARFQAKKELGRQLKKLEIEEFGALSPIDRVVIYQSILRPMGSEYLKLREIALT